MAGHTTHQPIPALESSQVKCQLTEFGAATATNNNTSAIKSLTIPVEKFTTKSASSP